MAASFPWRSLLTFSWRKCFLVCGVILVVWWPFTFDWIEVCGDCGVMRQSSARQLPMVPISFWTRHYESSTPLSQQVSPVVGTHTHRWSFVHGSGNGVLCAIGEGRHVASMTRNVDVLTFLQETQRYRSQNEFRGWLNIVLSEQHARSMRGWLLLDPPKSGLTREEYEAWRQRHDPWLADEGLERPAE